MNAGPIRIVVTGDRHWGCRDLARRVVARLVARHPAGAAGLLIVHGAASGVDAAFEAAAREEGVATEPHPARWDLFGDRAGPIRNTEMIRAGAKFVLAVHRDIGRSRGTKHCCLVALNKGIPVYVIESGDGRIRRATPRDIGGIST